MVFALARPGTIESEGVLVEASKVVAAHMVVDDRCTLCGVADSWPHALLDCTMSRCVWALVSDEITEHMSGSEEGDARLT